MALPPSLVPSIPPASRRLCPIDKCTRTATFVCPTCKQAPKLATDAPLVYYCSLSCQRTSDDHEALCQKLQDRTLVFRVIDLAQKLFYMYREITWCTIDITGVVISTKKKLLFWGSVNKTFDDRKPFPAKILPLENEKDRQAALSLLGSVESVLWMNEFIECFLKDIVNKTSFVKFKTYKEKRSIRIANGKPGGTNNLVIPREVNHDCVKITLRSGESFSIDLCGAGHGEHEPVWAWDEYEAKRTSIILSTLPSPPAQRVLYTNTFTADAQLRALRKSIRPRGYRYMFSDYLNCMNAILLEWQNDGKMSLKEVWGLPKKEFNVKLNNIENFCHWRWFTKWCGADYSTLLGWELRVLGQRREWVFE